MQAAAEQEKTTVVLEIRQMDNGKDYEVLDNGDLRRVKHVRREGPSTREEYEAKAIKVVFSGT